MHRKELMQLLIEIFIVVYSVLYVSFLYIVGHFLTAVF